jgi:hypothetical protein
MVDIANVFRPLKFARPLRTLAVTTVAEGRRLQTLITTWNDDGRLTRREMFDSDGNSRVVTVRRYDEPEFVETERTENARGETLGHRHVTRSAGGELVSESWHTYPVNVFVIDDTQFTVRDAARSIYRFTHDSRFIGAELINADHQTVAVVSVSYDDIGRRVHVTCDSALLKGEIQYRYRSDELTAELFLQGERVRTRHATFDANGRVILTTTVDDVVGHATRTRYDYTDNSDGDWIRLDVFDLKTGHYGTAVEREIAYR